jgi:hypothetical protein
MTLNLVLTSGLASNALIGHPPSLLHTHQNLEAGVGIEQVWALSAISKVHPQCLRHQRHAASKLSNVPIVRRFRRFVKPCDYTPTNHPLLRNDSAKTRSLALSLALFHPLFLPISTRRRSVCNILLQGSHFVSKDSQYADRFIKVDWHWHANRPLVRLRCFPVLIIHPGLSSSRDIAHSPSAGTSPPMAYVVPIRAE